MINKQMKEQQSSKDRAQEQNLSKKPNETGGFYFSSGLKIFDPNSKEMFVQKRGDD